MEKLTFCHLPFGEVPVEGKFYRDLEKGCHPSVLTKISETEAQVNRSYGKQRFPVKLDDLVWVKEV